MLIPDISTLFNSIHFYQCMLLFVTLKKKLFTFQRKYKLDCVKFKKQVTGVVGVQLILQKVF